MVRGYGRDRIQVYARIVHQLTSERMKPILEHCVWGPPARQQKEPFNGILTRPGSYKFKIAVVIDPMQAGSAMPLFRQTSRRTLHGELVVRLLPQDFCHCQR